MSMSQHWHRSFPFVAAILILSLAACVARTGSTPPTRANEAPAADDRVSRRQATIPAAPAARRANPVALALPSLQPRLGEPLNGLTNEQLQRFRDGRAAFVKVLKPRDGLGPIHNLHSCGGCHKPFRKPKE